MIFDKRYLLNYRSKCYSLEGEEGILEKIITSIPKNERDGLIVEFGAHDGISYSNSLFFIENHSFHAVEIEGDDERYTQLLENLGQYKVECIKSFIAKDGDFTLDNVLAGSNTDIHKDFDILVVDVDNNDYHLWEALKNYTPKVVMIEINSTLLPNEEKKAIYDAPFVFGEHGSSIMSMTELAKKKGYSLICNISCNAIYIRDEYMDIFFHESDIPTCEDLYTYEGISLRRWFFELSWRAKFRKGFEAMRRERALYDCNNIKAIQNIIKNIFIKTR